jgi:anti-sigma regulatory factor (Ser/Thr protein kinase)
LRSVRRGVLDRRFALEATVTGLVLAATCVLAFTRREHLMFLVVPVLGWIAWRLGKLGAATAALAVSTSATWAAVHEVGPFAHTSLADRMITLQSFNATVAFTTILLASAVSQRQRLAQRDHRMVETFQRSLLPEHMPDAAGIATAARYIAASADVEVGGDWYDIIPLADGRFGFAVGDVAGHGVPAAATMGQLRTALRAYALEDLAPSAVLGRMNRLLPGLEPTAMATAWYGTFDPATRCLVFSSAGHLPPLLLGNDDARYVDELHGPPLGAVTVVEYAERMCTLRSDQTIVLYTDGLIERRGQSIDDGLDALRTCAQESPRALEDMCDHLVAALLGAAPSDDAALLTIRPLVGARPELQFQRAASPAAVPEARRVLHTWLCDNAVSGDDRFDVLVATTEAYANAVQHAYGITVGTVEIDACISDREVNIAVKDHGSWRATGASRNGGGRGLAMMRALMDSVEVESNSHGTEIRMRRELTLQMSGD